MKRHSIALAVTPLALLAGSIAATTTAAAGPGHATKSHAPKVKLGTIFTADPKPHHGIYSFAPKSSGDIRPNAHIAGGKTAYYEPTVVAPAKDGSVWVGGIRGPIVRFAPGSDANQKPAQTIAGAKTKITEPTGIAVAADGSIWVANEGGELLHFGAHANGNVKPTQTITGPTTGITIPRALALTGDGKSVWEIDDASLREFSVKDDGDVAPENTISGPDTRLNGGVTQPGIYVTGNGSVWVSTNTAVQNFPAGSTGDAVPTVVSGAATGLLSPSEISPDADGNLWIANRNNGSIVELPSNASGNTPYIRDITGANTDQEQPWGVAVYGYRPGKVADLSATVKHRRTTIAWKKPKHTGGAVLAYLVQGRTGHHPWVQVYGGVAKTYTAPTSTAHSRRQYRVIAVNGYGYGASDATHVIPPS